MMELREVFEMVTKQTEPDLDSWKKQEDKQRRTSRNRKLGAVGLVAAIVVGLVVFALVRLPGGNGVPATSVSETPSVPFNTTPPIGAQLVAPDGMPVEQLPGSFSGDNSLQLSPDGTTIAYVTSGYVHTVRVDGTDDQTLTGANTNDGDAMNHVAWSPDGSELAYAYSGDIYVMKADGTDQHAITHAAGGTGYYYPVWSTDGTIAFWGGSRTGEDGGPSDSEIYTIPATGGEATRLTTNGVSNIEPSWSPDGGRIAYWDAGNLWIMRADGTDKHEVVPGWNAWAPAWSPDGKHIAFIAYVRNVTEAGGAPLMQLRTVELKTGNVTKLLVHSLTDGNGPQWVSDGEILINRYS